MSRTIPTTRLLFTVLLGSLAFAGHAQCKYEVDEVDAITNQRVLLTKPDRIHDGAKVKAGISVGHLDMKLGKNANGVTLELHAQIKNPRAYALRLRVPNDSLTIKFTDGSLIVLPNLTLARRYTHHISSKPMLAFTYVLTEEVKAKFRAGEKIEVLRITSTDQNWDFVGLTGDPGQVFRDCLDKE